MPMTRRVTERRMVLHMNSRGDSLQDAVGITKIKIIMAVATTPVVNWARSTHTRMCML